MIAFRIDGQELDLDPGVNVQVEYYNALFEYERIPAMFTMPLTLKWSKKNMRLLQFPGNLSVRRYRREPFACEMYLDNLWRVGKLFILGTNSKGISVNFQSDAGDLSEGFKNDSLREIDLGSEPYIQSVKEIYPAANYALFPVKNEQFYGDPEETGALYAGYINYYNNGFRGNTVQYPSTPFPYLVHVLRQVMAHYGYRLTGNWLEEERVRRLVIYNNRAFDLSNKYDYQVIYNQHVPDMKVADFIKAIRTTFGLGFSFNTTARTIEIIRLQDVVKDLGYVDWRKRSLAVTEWRPNSAKGFTLMLSPDSNDELNDILPEDASKLKIRHGATEIPFNLGTLQMLRTLDGDRVWEVPQVSQEGISDYQLEGSAFSLSLLSYHGLQPDSQGNLYPFATSGTTNYSGAEVGQLALSLSGAKGLYEQCHRHWLEFLSEADAIDTEIDLSLTDLRTLRPERKVLVQAEQSIVKALWTKVTVVISQKDGVKTAKAPLLKISN